MRFPIRPSLKKSLSYLLPLLAFLIILVFVRCSSGNKGVVVDITASPFKQFSQYGFYQGEIKNLEASERVLPYDLITPLFTDYAHKSRAIWMPEGSAATYRTGEVLDFPKGTVLIKHFYYPADFSKPEGERRIIETRLLMNRNEGWENLSYIWNDEQTEANLEIAGDIKDVSWVNETGETVGTNYVIPNKNQCKGCHVYGKDIRPIGPKVRNLNKEFEYKEGTMNQLQKWAEVGYLSGYTVEKESPALVNWEDENESLNDRAIAYLDVNCGHCHNPQGPGGVSGLNLDANNPMGATYGLCKAPVAAAMGSGGRSYDIIPSEPDNSIFVYRMESTDPGTMMPELGRTLSHKEGVKLIYDWIAAMDPESCDVD